jgi:hypothetical protein
MFGPIFKCFSFLFICAQLFLCLYMSVLIFFIVLLFGGAFYDFFRVSSCVVDPDA